MTLPDKNSNELQKKLSRRNMLRSTAIAAAGAIALPSFISGCTKEQWGPVKGGIGGTQPWEPLTGTEIQRAAQNLKNMGDFIGDLYPFCIEYEVFLYALLKSGTKPSGWQSFIVDVFINIALGMLGAAAGEIPGAGAAIAIVADNIKKWASGDKPGNLDADFSEFVEGHTQMQKAITDKILLLTDVNFPANDYKNLQEGFKGEIDFNGKKYNLRDLALSQFPSKDNGTAFVALRTAAFEQFKKHMWNVMLMKAGRMTKSYTWTESAAYNPPTQYARDVHYKDDRYKSTYLRGLYDLFWTNFHFSYWYFSFDGLELSSDAAKILFKDDSPGNIINPDGMFTRTYVFEQFHAKKPDFSGFHELRKDLSWGYYQGDSFGFDAAAGPFEFTGGDFPMLIKP